MSEEHKAPYLLTEQDDCFVLEIPEGEDGAPGVVAVYPKPLAPIIPESATKEQRTHERGLHDDAMRACVSHVREHAAGLLNPPKRQAARHPKKLDWLG